MQITILAVPLRLYLRMPPPLPVPLPLLPLLPLPVPLVPLVPLLPLPVSLHMTLYMLQVHLHMPPLPVPLPLPLLPLLHLLLPLLLLLLPPMGRRMHLPVPQTAHLLPQSRPISERIYENKIIRQVLVGDLQGSALTSFTSKSKIGSPISEFGANTGSDCEGVKVRLMCALLG
jgi:hypothetical protein